MKPEKTPEVKKSLPDRPPARLGNLTQADICHEYDLNIKIILRGLSDRNIQATEFMTLKEIAAENETAPVEIFETLKEVAGT
jgi:hypothetical protein